MLNCQPVEDQNIFYVESQLSDCHADRIRKTRYLHIPSAFLAHVVILMEIAQTTPI